MAATHTTRTVGLVLADDATVTPQQRLLVDAVLNTEGKIPIVRAAAILSCHRSAVWKYIKSSASPLHPVGRSGKDTLVRLSDLISHITQHNPEDTPPCHVR